MNTGKLLDQARALYHKLSDEWFRAYYAGDDDRMLRLHNLILRVQLRKERRYWLKQRSI
jgi:hypothetical protein